MAQKGKNVKKDINKKVLKEENENDLDSDSMGEDPKKRLKVNPNWGLLK